MNLGQLKPDPQNRRRHTSRNVGAIVDALHEVGAARSIVIDENNTVLAGNATLKAAAEAGIERVQVVDADGETIIAVRRSGLTDDQKRRLALFDNRAAELAEWDTARLLEDLNAGLDFSGLWSTEELEALLRATGEETGSGGLLPGTDPDAVPEEVETRCQPGDLWELGRHRLIIGDCRDFGTVQRLFGEAKANVVVTSPPYASQRAYDEESGFKPILPDEYGEWYRDVQAGILAFLADDGSYFLNIKEHCEDGQRHLYVKDLTLQHVREWGWRFVDEFCWLTQAFPGAFAHRFKNGWEPVFHFCRQEAIKFHPEAVSEETDGAFSYRRGMPTKITDCQGKGGLQYETGQGLSRPSNVLKRMMTDGQGHQAAYPVALPEFFLKAFSDPGDAAYDPFLGSGTTLIAAEQTGRRAFGCEISPKYGDVILARWEQATGQTARRVG